MNIDIPKAHGSNRTINTAPRKQPSDMHRAALPNCAERLHISRDRIDVKVAPAGNVVNAILGEAADYDLVVLGCTRKPVLRQIGRNPVPETVAQRCDTPLVMVRAAGGIRSWVRRWI